MERWFLIIGSIAAVFLPVAFALFFLSTTGSEDPAKELLPYFGGLFGAFLGFLALMWAAIFNSHINRKEEALREKNRQLALCRVLESECRALGARCIIWKSQFGEARKKGRTETRYQVSDFVEFLPLVTIERHMDEIGGLDEKIVEKAFGLQHSLAAAQLTLEASRSKDATLDTKGLDDTRDWLEQISDDAADLGAKLEAFITRYDQV